MTGRLTEAFRGIVDKRWSEFCALEESIDATNFDSVLTGLVRACKKGNLRAIQTALDRLDGPIAKELEVEYPKFYQIYPYAKKKADDPTIIDEISEISTDDLNLIEAIIPKNEGTIIKASTPPTANKFAELVGSPADVEEQAAMEEELPTGSLRAVLERMLDSPKSLVSEILATAEIVDGGNTFSGNPMVKSVVVAGLMKLVHEGKISAVFEVFDQIDGKVAEKVKIFGKDVAVKRFDKIAPANAIKNSEGVYYVESPIMTDAWALRLEQNNKKGTR